MSENKPLECPFCGQQPEIEERLADGNRIVCWKIKCSNKFCHGSPQGMWADSKEWAIINWNNRIMSCPNCTRLQSELAEARAMCVELWKYASTTEDMPETYHILLQRLKKMGVG